MKRSVFIIFMVFVLFGLWLAACQPLATGTPSATITPTIAVEGTPVPFETIQKSELGPSLDVIGGAYQGEEPVIIALTELGDLSQLGGISSEAREAIAKTDFDQYFVIAVFQGQKGTDGYGVNIQSVSRKDELIIVYADLITPPTPPPVVGLNAIETSPYQLIKVKKEDLTGAFTIQLIIDNEIIQQIEVGRVKTRHLPDE